MRSGESNEIVGQEIPDGHHGNGEKLGNVKVKAPALDDQPQDKIVDPQPDHADDKEFGILPGYIRIAALEGPDPVEQVIGGSGNGKTNGVGKIFLNPENLLANIGHTKINQQS